MIFPKFPEQGSALGICAPSAGVGHKIKLFDKSLAALKSSGFDIIETASVRNDNVRSADAKTRSEEFNFLVQNPDVEMIVSAAGGDYNIEILPYLDTETLANYPKWIAGASDPTNIMYYVTTKLDIATMYGFNAGSFDWDTLHEFQKNSLKLMCGNTIKQYSFDKYDSNTDFSVQDVVLDGDVNWQLSMPGTDEIIDNMAQGRRDIAVMYSGDAAYVMKENKDMAFWLPKSGTNVWSDAMVIPKNAKEVDLAHEFINFVTSRDIAYKNSEYVGYSSPNDSVFDEMRNDKNAYGDISAYTPRVKYPKDEVFAFDEINKKIISNLWSKVKIYASTKR